MTKREKERGPKHVSHLWMNEFENVGNARFLSLTIGIRTTNVRTYRIPIHRFYRNLCTVMLDEEILVEADVIGISEHEVFGGDLIRGLKTLPYNWEKETN